MRTVKTCIAFLTVSVALLGCHTDPPIDPKTSADQAATRASAVVRAAGSSFGFLGEEGSVLRKMVGGADDATYGIMRKAVPPPMPTPLIRTLMGSPVVKTMGGVEAIPSFLTAEEQFDETARDIEVLLRDRLLVESNIESKTDWEITYLLKPEPTCRPLPSSGSTAPSAECVRDLPRLQVRLVTHADGDGLRMRVLVGPARLELSAFVIHSDLLGWEVDFAHGLKAVEFINMTLAPDEPREPNPFSQLAGRIRLNLQKLGPEKVKGSVAIMEDVNFQADGGEEGPISFHSGRTDPLFALTADGVAKSATATWGLAQTDVKAPWDPMDLAVRNQDLHVSIGGLYGEATVTEGKQEIAFKGVGAGASFVAVRGVHIFDLGFNPASGRKFDLLVTAAGDVPRFAVTPKFDLSLAFNLGAVAADFKEPPPAPLLHETYTVLLDGATPAVLEPVKETPTFHGGLKVVAGTLTIATNGMPATTVSVPSGMCLTGKERPMGAHEVLGGLAVVSCP
jgi:hypothetical protein